MNRLLAVCLVITLSGTAPLTLAGPDKSSRGLLQTQRDDGPLARKVHREHPGAHGRGHHRHPHHNRGPRWARGDRSGHYRDDRRHRHDSRYQKHRHSHRDQDRGGSFFGVVGGRNGVLIWKAD